MTVTSPSRSSRKTDSPALRTRIADRVNALVWRLPVPRRARVLLSQLTYRNPPIAADRVIETLHALDRAGIETVLIGGWGIDALLGKQMRPHRDLDLLADEHDLGRAILTLEELGFEPWNHDSSPGPIGTLAVSSGVTLRDSALRVVELHACDLDGFQATEGAIDGDRVSCLSADLQLEAQHAIGRTLTPGRFLSRRRNLAVLLLALQQSSQNL